MNCPDCKIAMELIKDYMGDMSIHQALLINYWKCPKCKIEIEEEQ